MNSFLKRKYLLITIGLLLCHSFSFGESIKIGLNQFQKTSQAQVQCLHGNYIIYENQLELFRMATADQYTVVNSEGKLIIRYHKKKYVVQSLLMKINAQNSEFVISTISPQTKKRRYQDNLILKLRGDKIKFINELNLDKYVAGVVQAEAGNNWSMEFYKVQAVISRTYALANKRRHETEGFHLCDRVHCQVYNHKTENPDIIEAAYLTSGYVITDAEINLITAAFHSNCGGYTQNSEDVWSSPRSYLVGIKDTFCLKMPHATWQKNIPLIQWKKYLLEKNSLTINDSISEEEALTWSPLFREAYFNNHTLQTKDIRMDWKLKSSYFTVNVNENQVIIKGKGFGHGVGLCQEGAMHMAEEGYNYQQILQFYYKDIHLIDLKFLDFFRD